MALTTKLTILSALFFIGINASAQQQTPNFITQQLFLARAAQFNPTTSVWIKPEPGLAYRIPQAPNIDITNLDRLNLLEIELFDAFINSIPAVIRDNVGTIDDINRWLPDDQKIRSLNEYFFKMAGSVINLQYANGKADFYAIGPDVWRDEYVEVPAAEAIETNTKLVRNLSNIGGMAEFINSGDPNLIGVKKMALVLFVRASALRFPVEEEFTLLKPDWGEGQTQTKPAWADAFVRFEVKGDGTVSSYIVNTEAVRLEDGSIVGRPIAYVPKDEMEVRIAMGNTGTPLDMPAQFEGKSGLDEWGVEQTPAVYGLKPEQFGMRIRDFLDPLIAKKSKGTMTLDSLISCDGLTK